MFSTTEAIRAEAVAAADFYDVHHRGCSCVMCVAERVVNAERNN